MFFNKIRLRIPMRGYNFLEKEINAKGAKGVFEVFVSQE
ncbi:hypothetical protein BGS_0131 [Beggiatoa sp. SS]|nr:hypothetical protein BGS_0131 [Beggiatoa sp. SS]